MGAPTAGVEQPHGSYYFVVRARDSAGSQDDNTVEKHGIDPCY
jgi:hypothetical protein